MALVLPCVKVVGVRCSTHMSNQLRWFEVGKNSSWSREVKRRGRKKKKKKEKTRSWSALQHVSSSPT